MAKTTFPPETSTPPRDDLVPAPPPAPTTADTIAVVTALVVLVAAIVFLPGAVTGDVELGPDGEFEAVSGTEIWGADVPPAATTPVVRAEVVLVGQGIPETADGVPTGDPTAQPATVRAIHPVTGAQRWSATLEGAVAVPVATSDGIALVRTETAVAALDVDTGEVLWDRAYAPERPSPAAAAGKVMVPGANLTALELDSGEVAWQRRFPVSEPPTVHDGVAYAVAPGAVRAVDVSDGDERWAVALDSPADFAVSPAVAGELVVVANQLGDLEAFDRDDGTRRWAVRTRVDDPTVTLLVADDTVLAGGASGALYAHDLQTGTPRWRVPTDVDLARTNAVQAAGKAVVVGGPPSGQLLVIDREQGDVLWTLRGGEATTAPLALASTLVVAVQPDVGPAANDLVALHLDDGSERWRTPLQAVATGPPLPAGGDSILLLTRSAVGEADRIRAFT